MVVVVLFCDKYPLEILVTEPYMKLNFVSWFFYWYISILFVRANYYFAWTFG